METIRKIKIGDLPEFTVVYSNRYFERTDTEVTLYETEKISILMTDGLFAVVGNKVYTSEMGDVLFFGRDELHFGRLTRAGKQEYIDFFLTADFVRALGGESFARFLTDRAEERTNRFSPSSDIRREILGMANEVKRELTGGEDFSDVAIFSHLLRIITYISRSYENERTKSFDSSIPFCVRKALDVISERYAESITLTEIANICSCSVTYLSRSFKNIVGTSVYQYLTDYRLKKAQKLLKEGASVTEICYAVGFSDTSNFIRTFKTRFGATPHKYKTL